MPFKADEPSVGKFVADVEVSSPKFKYDRDTSQDIPFSEKAKGVVYGAATGAAGGLGELEKFGAYTVPEMLGLREEGSRDKLLDRETIFPTIEEARKGLSYLGVEPPTERAKSYVTGGEFLGGFAGSLPGVLKGGTKALTGIPSKTSEEAARAAESLGFKLSPAQVKQDMPVGSKGATGWSAKNQETANKLASKTTGKEVSEISPDFVRDRLRKLGNEFDDLYRGQVFQVDDTAADAIRQIANIETTLPANARVPAVQQTANNIIDRFGQGNYSIQGEELTAN